MLLKCVYSNNASLFCPGVIKPATRLTILQMLVFETRVPLGFLQCVSNCIHVATRVQIMRLSSLGCKSASSRPCTQLLKTTDLEATGLPDALFNKSGRMTEIQA